MKAVILAAGKGSRLGDITQQIPKPMIVINGMPILEHNLKMCINAGINDIYINLHHCPEIIRNYFGDGSKYGVKIRYNFENELLGTGGAISPFINFLIEEPFFVIYGDNYFDFDLDKIKIFHEEKKADISILFHWRNDVTNSGIAQFDKNNQILKFIEKPKDRINGDWVNAGIYYIDKSDIFKHIKVKDDFGINIFPKLLTKNYKIFGYKASINLIAIDTPDMLKKSKTI